MSNGARITTAAARVADFRLCIAATFAPLVPICAPLVGKGASISEAGLGIAAYRTRRYSVMRQLNGFTLIELLVAVAIVGILTAIALPSYRDYVTRGKLAEAYQLLSSQRVKMEQYYQDVHDYTAACAAGTVATPSPGTYFALTCGNLSANTYTLTATGL